MSNGDDLDLSAGFTAPPKAPPATDEFDLSAGFSKQDANRQIQQLTNRTLSPLPTFAPRAGFNLGPPPARPRGFTETDRASNVLAQQGLTGGVAPPQKPVPFELGQTNVRPFTPEEQRDLQKIKWQHLGPNYLPEQQFGEAEQAERERQLDAANPIGTTGGMAQEAYSAEASKMKAGASEFGTGVGLLGEGDIAHAPLRLAGGGFKMADPLLAAAYASSPISTVGGLALGMGLSEGAGATARAFHASPETEQWAELAGAVAGGVYGGYKASALEMRGRLIGSVTNDYMARGVSAEQAAAYARADVDKFWATGNGDTIGMPGLRMPPLINVGRSVGAGVLGGLRHVVPFSGEAPERRVGVPERPGPLGEAGYQAPGPPTMPPEPTEQRPGALGQMARTLAPQYFSSPEHLATQAFRPRNSKWDWQAEISSALPDMKRGAQSLGIDEKGMTMRNALDSAETAQDQVWAEYENRYLGPSAGKEMDVQSVGDAMRGVITPRMREQNPQLAAEIERKAATYDKQTLNVRQLQQRVTELNNETRAIEAKYVVDQAAAKNSPDNAFLFRERDVLRSLLDEAMDESGPGGAALRRRYGALTSVRDVISRRLPVVERQSKWPLPRILSTTAAAGQIALGIGMLNPRLALSGAATIAAERYLHRITDPDYLTSRAFQKTEARAPWQLFPVQGGLPFPPIGLFGHQQTPAPQRTGPFAMPPSSITPEEQNLLPAGPAGPETLPPGAPQQGPPARLVTPQITEPSRLLGPARLPQSIVNPTPGFEAPTAPSASAEQALLQQERAKGRGVTQTPTSGPENAPAGTGTTPQGTPEKKLNLFSDLVPPWTGAGTAQLDLPGLNLPRRAEPFYSKAEQVADAKLPKVGSGDQFLATLKNNGVKTEEIADLGLDDFAGKQKVTKEEFLNAIRSRRTPLEQTTLGEPEFEPRHATMYEDYATPGGTNYREHLIQYPPSEAGKRVEEMRDYIAQRKAELNDEIDQHNAASPEEQAKWPDDYFDKQREHIDYLEQQLREAKARSRETDYQSGHWTEHSNVLAHARESDFTTTDGMPVRHVHEWQSDLHQLGREEGYRKPMIRTLPEGYHTVRNDAGFYQITNREGRPMQDRTFAKQEDAIDSFLSSYNSVMGQGRVPNAPFKKSWHELAVKDSIRRAINDGMSGMTWDTGETQANRYDLRKQVERIEYDPHTETLNAFDHRGKNVVNESVKPDDLHKYVGKEAAQKLHRQIDNYTPISEDNFETRYDPDNETYKVYLDGEWVGEEESRRDAEHFIQDYIESEHNNTLPKLEGEDLQVGGHGMEGFYDKIIPDFVNKYVKKWGAKVDTAEIPSSESSLPYEVVDRNGEVYDGYRTREQAEAAIRDLGRSDLYRVREPDTQTVHRLTFTPEMIRDIKSEGQPLYSPETTARGEDEMEAARRGAPGEAPPPERTQETQQANIERLRQQVDQATTTGDRSRAVAALRAAEDELSAQQPDTQQATKQAVDQLFSGRQSKIVQDHEDAVNRMLTLGRIEDADWNIIRPGRGLPNMVALNDTARALVGEALGSYFGGVSVHPRTVNAELLPRLEIAARAIENLRDVGYTAYHEQVPSKLRDLARAIQENNGPEGTSFVRSTGTPEQQRYTLAEEGTHTISARRPGMKIGDPQGFAIPDISGDPGLDKMAPRIDKEVPNAGDHRNMIVHLEGIADIMQGRAPELTPEEAGKTAEEYWSRLAASGRHGLQAVVDQFSWENFMDDDQKAKGYTLTDDVDAIRTAGRDALARVLSRHYGEDLRGLARALQGEPQQPNPSGSQGGGNPSVSVPDRGGQTDLRHPAEDEGSAGSSTPQVESPLSIFSPKKAYRPGDEHVVSTRKPTGKPEAGNNQFDHRTDRSRTIGMKEIEDAGIANEAVAAIKNYPGVKGLLRGVTDPHEALQKFVDFAADNITAIYQAIPKEIRNMSRRWYPSANKLATNLADTHSEHGMTMPQAAAVIAVHSPQTEWNVNASLAKRTMDIWLNKQNQPYTQNMADAAKEITATSLQPVLRAIKGKSLGELTNPEEQAMWVRLYDEGENPREYESLRPDGTSYDVTRKKQTPAQKRRGEPGTPKDLPWGSLPSIMKAISIMEDGSLANISDKLGDEHKVRNFYNNIVNPDGLHGHVTVDTHAVGAGLFKAVSTKDIEVKHNFGGQQKASEPGELPVRKAIPGSGSNQNHGVSSGVYGLYVDAYRKAAKRVGEQPQFLQSITWEGIRALFPQGFKSEENKDIINKIWKRLDRDPDYTPAQARREVIDATAKLKGVSRSEAWGKPDWVGERSDFGVHEAQQPAANKKGVAGSGVHGPLAGGNRAGAGSAGSPRASRQVIPPQLKRVIKR